MMDNYSADGDRTRHSLEGHGVLLINMGGPGSLDEVEPYLFRLFADPNMIQLSLGHFCQKGLARFVSSRRAPRVRKRYEEIGGKSPILPETKRIAENLSLALDIPVACGMRYSDPGVADALRELQAEGVDHLILLPLYPQFSKTTTMSALNEFERIYPGAPLYQVVLSHHNDRGYIDALTSLLKCELKAAEAGIKTHVLFVAHSIPERYIKRGDPYVAQTEETVNLVGQAIGKETSWSLAYQSQIGPVRWKGPTLREELEVLRAEKVEQLVVHPVSFVSENMETLYDLDIVFKGECVSAGIEKFIRVPAVGSSSRYVEALAGLVQKAAAKREVRHA